MYSINISKRMTSRDCSSPRWVGTNSKAKPICHHQGKGKHHRHIEEVAHYAHRIIILAIMRETTSTSLSHKLYILTFLPLKAFLLFLQKVCHKLEVAHILGVPAVLGLLGYETDGCREQSHYGGRESHLHVVSHRSNITGRKTYQGRTHRNQGNIR